MKSVRIQRNSVAYLCAASALALLAPMEAANAQCAPDDALCETGTPQAGQGTGFGDIIVTARRRSESLQDVPIAITAMSGDLLQERNISNVTALDGLAPNLKVIQNGANTVSYVQIRGSVTSNPNPGYEPAAAMYIDGVYIGKNAGSMMEISDIEHIEILRGPQGTLFGRNTLAGAINVVTRKPTGEWGGRLKVGIGNFDRRVGQFSLDLPRMADFSVKLSGLWSEQEGFVKARANPYPGVGDDAPTIKRVGDEKSKALRAAVRYDPSDVVTIDYTFDYNRIRNTALGGVLQQVGENNIFDPNSPAYINIPLYLYVQPGSRPRDYYGTDSVNGDRLAENVDSYMHTLTAVVEVGEATIKSITGYRDMDWHQRLDLDGSPLDLAAAGSDLSYKQYSQELQVSGQVGSLVYTAGFYYFKDNGKSTNPQEYFGVRSDSRADFKTNAWALYGQVDYTPPILDERLVLTAGFRYSDEKKRIDREASVGGVVTIPAGTELEKKFSSSTPTFVVKYDISDTANVYAKYAAGYKSGGFTTDTTNYAAAITPYDPEKVDSYEIGTKLRLFDGRMTFNIAGFLEKHTDQQINVFSPSGDGFVTLTANGARSEIKGLEVEANARPFDGLILTGSAGYTDVKFKEYYPVIGGENVGNTNAIPFVPKWTVNLGANASLFESDDLAVNLAVDMTYASSYASLAYSTLREVDPNIYNTLGEALTTVDARLMFSEIPFGNSTLQATVYAKNLFNASARTAGIDFGSDFGGIVVRNDNRPRQVGLDLSLRF